MREAPNTIPNLERFVHAQVSTGELTPIVQHQGYVEANIVQVIDATLPEVAELRHLKGPRASSTEEEYPTRQLVELHPGNFRAPMGRNLKLHLKDSEPTRAPPHGAPGRVVPQRH